MEEENSRYCAMCGQPLKKHQKKFCSLYCSALFRTSGARNCETGNCLNCGRIFLKKYEWEKFCSLKCESSFKYKSLDFGEAKCLYCGGNFTKHYSKQKFCSRECANAGRGREIKESYEEENYLEEEKMTEKITDNSLNNILDPEYSDKDFLGVSADTENKEYTKYGEEILFSFTPNYTSDIPIGTATVYGTPKALADYQFEYFRQKNETTKNADKRISLRIYMMTGDICGEPKDISAFQIAYEKLLEKSTEKTDSEKAEENAPKDVEQKNEVTEIANDALNNPANFENWTEF